MKYVVVSQGRDQEEIENYQVSFRKYSNEALIEAYNKQARLGIVGVHQQAWYLLALRQVLIERFGESHVELEDGCVISLKGPIVV